MFDRFKKVFIICSLDHYDFLEEHKDEILEPYKKQKIEMPFLFDNDIELEKEKLKSITKKSNNNVDKIIEEVLLEEKFEDAKKRMKNAHTCIFINPDEHPNKLVEELSVSSSVEATLELLEARHMNINITSIRPYDFNKNKTL